MSEVTKGQASRRMIRIEIEQSLNRYLPMNVSKLANLIAYDFNLSPYTVRYTYLPMFSDVGIIQYGQDGKIYLTEKGKQLQTTPDGLTIEEVREEWQEENLNRVQFGKPEIPFEEWLKIRPSRDKP